MKMFILNMIIIKDNKSQTYLRTLYRIQMN